MLTDRQTDVGHINLIGGLVTRNPPNKGIISKINFNLSSIPSNKLCIVYYLTIVNHNKVMKLKYSIYLCDIQLEYFLFL